MATIEEIFAQLEEAARNPLAAVTQAKEEGKKVVGCVPYFAPMELVHAAGMHPVELWGGGKITGTGSSYYPAFYCSVLFTLIERALDGTYDDLDAVIVPTTCDGLRNLVPTRISSTSCSRWCATPPRPTAISATS